MILYAQTHECKESLITASSSRWPRKRWLIAGVLVHCGAGVSRSASLCIAYLMRRNAWNAAKARKHCQQRRSLVNPNDGFWRSLCAFEQVLGITDRYTVIEYKAMVAACVQLSRIWASVTLPDAMFMRFRPAHMSCWLT